MTDQPGVPQQLPDAIRQQLAAGEQVLWHGVPRQGWLLRASDAWMIPFSLLWAGFAFYWEWTALTMGNVPVFFMLWGLPFVWGGLYIVVGRFWFDARRRASTHYALTSERALIASGTGGRRIQSLSLGKLSNVALVEHANGLGTITLGRFPAQGGMAGGPFPVGWPGAPQPGPQFEAVPDAPYVFRLIRDAQRRPG